MVERQGLLALDSKTVWRDGVLTPIGFSLAYFLGAELGHKLSFPGDFASIWPPAGLLLSALLLSAPRAWPGLIVGAWLANLTSDIAFHGKTWPVSVGFCVANSAEALIGAALLRCVVGSPFSLDRFRNVAWFVVIAAGVSCVVGATLGATVVSVGLGGPFRPTWDVWWSSGILGVLLLVPVIVNMTTLRPWREPEAPRQAFEMGLFVLLASAATLYVFGLQTAPLPYLLLPIVVAASVRLRLCGVSFVTMAITGIAVWCTTHGRGPFAVGHPIAEQVILTQGFLCVTIVLALVLAVLTQERQAALDSAEAARRALETANNQLRRQATTDGLTGVANRRAFQTRLDEELARSRRSRTPLSLILLDVDHFKAYNDTFGHVAGDEVLRAVGNLLAATARETDFVARYGGEEFAILCPETSAGGASILADRLREAIEGSPWPDRAITASLGVATVTSERRQALDLIDRADQALYRSKSDGRNRVTVAEAASGSYQTTSG